MQLNKQMVLNDIKVIEDKLRAFELMSTWCFAPCLNNQYFSKYSSIYPFTNDKLELLFKYLDLKKRILTVTSSGDHALFAILNGSKLIDCFDVNSLSKYFMELKISAIKALDYKEFMKFYKIKEMTPLKIENNPNFLIRMNPKYLNKILKLMPDYYAYFFELFYELIRFKDTMLDVLINFNFVPSYSGYLKKDKFYALKDRLQDDISINYYDCDIFDLKKHIGNKKYSAFLFSNITSYFDDEQLEKLFSLLTLLDGNFESDALVQFGYGSSEFGLQQIGKNRVKKEFVDSHGKVLFDIEEDDKVITFYKSKKYIKE